MRDLESHIKTFFEAYPAKKYLIACSAGIDSTVLLHLCISQKIPVEIVHVNYHLRGEDSNKDEKFLADLSSKIGVPFNLKSIQLNEILKEGGNLQSLARDVRYHFFNELLGKNEDSYVLLAHHKEDQSETFFMNLTRESGVMGLASMPEKRGNFIRPLLSISKKELIDYALETGIQWREDISNASNKYTRNIWRNEILPNLRKELPQIDDSVQALVGAFQETQSALEFTVATHIQSILKYERLMKSEFDQLNEFERIELCRQLDQPIGLMETWSKLDHKGTKVDFVPNRKFPFHAIVFDGNQYTFLRDEESVLPQLNIDSINSLPDKFSKEVIYLDPEKISGNLIVRKLEEGDRIHPIGMKGSKLVSDVISDAKLNAKEKEKVCVVCDQQHILWVPELAISRKGIANSSSKSILKISLLS